MENKNKNKKKLFAIIGASALAFVLTIALSVSITLAYFGGTSTGNATITLGAAVKLNESATVTANPETVIPTQKYTVTATAEGEASTTDSVLFAVVGVETTGTSIKNNPTIDSAWTKYGTDADGNDVYYLGTAGTVTQLGTTAVNKTLTYTDTVGTALTNTDAGATMKVTVTFVRVQVVYNSEGTTLQTSASSYEAVVEDIANIQITAA